MMSLCVAVKGRYKWCIMQFNLEDLLGIFFVPSKYFSNVSCSPFDCLYFPLSVQPTHMLSLILPTCQRSADMMSPPCKQRGCGDMEIFSLLRVVMINDWRGVAVGRAGFSLRSGELSLKRGLWSRDVHKHAHKIRSLSRWYSVLGRGTKSQIGIH